MLPLTAPPLPHLGLDQGQGVGGVEGVVVVMPHLHPHLTEVVVVVVEEEGGSALFTLLS